MATTTTNPSHLTSSFTQNHSFNSPSRTTISFRHRPSYPPSSALPINCHFVAPSWKTLKPNYRIVCKATEVSVTEESPSSGSGNWVPVVPLAALPRGERRVIIQDGETILLLWYKEQVYAIENRSPAEGAYSEGLLNAKLTQDGCIVCPTTDSTFDLRTGAVKEWYPNNSVLRVLTPALRTLFVYPVKVMKKIFTSVSVSEEV